MIEKNVNIGLIIEQKLNELGINKSEFGRRIGIANQNVNRILEKKSIDTDKLIEISNALGYNFFSEFIDEGNNAVANGDGSVAVSGNNNTSVVNGALATGNGSVAVNGNNSNHVVAGGETALLQERIKHLEDLVAEKERLIQVLMEGRK